MTLSPLKTKEAKSLKVSVQEMVLADLLSIGYSEEDAYTIAYPDDAMLNSQAKKSAMSEVINRDKFKQLCDTRREKNAGFLSVENDAENLDLISAEDVAKEVLLAAKKQPVGSKERADLMAKYNDIRNENKKEIADPNEDPVQFFFPIACEKCPLLQTYNEFIAKKNENKPRDKWVMEVIPDEMQRICEQADKRISRVR